MNYYDKLQSTTQALLKKNKISMACFNRIICGIIHENSKSKLYELPDYVRVYEPGIRTHTKYEFYKFDDCESNVEINKIISAAWIELKKITAAEEKENKIAEEFGNKLALESLTNELRNMNLYAFHESTKYGQLKFYLPFSKDKPKTGCSKYYIFVDNKQYFTIEEKEEIENKLRLEAKNRIDELKNEYEQLKKFYGI